MRFIIDAQLPPSICRYFVELGHDAIHTSQLPNGNLTADEEIREISEKDNRIVVTKDTDFYHTKVAKNIPNRLVLVTAGNLRLSETKALFKRNISNIVDALEQGTLIELTSDSIRILY